MVRVCSERRFALPSLRLAPKLFAKTATANLTTLFFFDGAKERKKKNNERRKKDGVKIPLKKDKQKLSSSFFRRPSRFNNTTINYTQNCFYDRPLTREETTTTTTTTTTQGGGKKKMFFIGTGASRATSSLGCSSSSPSSVAAKRTCAEGRRLGFVGHHHHHHHHFHREQKRRTTRPNSSNIVIVRAKKESSTSSFDQLPEMTEDETAKKWAGESNQSPTMMVNAKESVGTNKIKKKEDAREEEVLEGEVCLLGDGIWEKLCEEADEIELEPALASYLYSTILCIKKCRMRALFWPTNLGSSVLLDSQLLELFSKCYREDPALVQCATADMQAVLERDPACDKYVMILLYFKGFQALQAQRIAHSLWLKGRQSLALLLQHRISEAFHVDAHPAAKIGKGVMIDHATGVVIGETAVVGNNVSILHNVTLGGTGTTDGNRHPKIGDGVVLGAGTTILGPVNVGANAKIGAGSVVLQDIPDNSVAVGIPAKILRRERSKEVVEPSLSMDQTDFIEGWDFTI